MYKDTPVAFKLQGVLTFLIFSVENYFRIVVQNVD